MTKSTEAGRKFVEYALSIGALELLPNGRPLKSGRISPYFFNSGLFNTGQSIGHLAQAYAAAIIEADGEEQAPPEVIYGPPYKGIPLAVMVAAVLSGKAERYRDIAWAFSRKETKDHGEGGLLVGANLKELRVVIADDVMTDGATKGEAVKFIEEQGGFPIACVIAFDRQERGNDVNDPRAAAQVFAEKYGIPVLAAATFDDLIQVLEEGPAVPLGAETLPLILRYRDEYGVK